MEGVTFEPSEVEAASPSEGGDPGPASTADAGLALRMVQESLIGNSPAFVRVMRKIPRLASSDATVLITGETGTGKELIAQAIHAASLRRLKPFIPVNCGSLPEDLVENELFGHARGAYTGAAANGKGLLAEAEGGTLLLDELNSLSLSAQSKLLRFLQNREYRQLGSTKLLRANVRILAATNVDLRRQVGLTLFRSDLFHRLHVLSIELPPLRERVEDIPELAQHFADRYAGQYGKRRARLLPMALQKLMGGPWPGNVRELQSVIERSVLLAPGEELGPQDIDLAGSDAWENENAVATDAVSPDLDPPPAAPTTFREAKEGVIKQFERDYLIQVMASAQGNVSRAARLAGMQRRDFQRLLRKHRVRLTESRALLHG